MPDRFSLFRFIVQNMEPIHHATGEEEDYGGHRRGCQNLQQEHHHVSVLIHLVHRTYILTVDGISGKASQSNLPAPQSVMLTPDKNTL